MSIRRPMSMLGSPLLILFSISAMGCAGHPATQTCNPKSPSLEIRPARNNSRSLASLGGVLKFGRWPLAEVTVTISDPFEVPHGGSVLASTNREGRFFIHGMTPGEYELRIMLDGFERFDLAPLKLRSGRHLDLSMCLRQDLQERPQ